MTQSTRADHGVRVSRSSSIWRAVLASALAGAFFVQARRQFFVIREGTQPYLIGDWTISYSGGFVRRGFLGEALGLLAGNADTFLTVLFVIQTALYALIFGVAIRWAINLPDPARWVPLLLSPTFLLFGFHDFGGSHRKEIIVLAAIFLLAESVRTGRGVRTISLLAIPFMAVGVLSHEANALLVAPLVVLLRLAADRSRLSRNLADLTSLALLGVSILGLLLSLLFPGTVEQQAIICQDLQNAGFTDEICEGSLSFVGNSLPDAVSYTLAFLPNNSLYLFTVVFSSVPFLLSPWARRNQRLLLVATAPLLPLFVVGIDWGRWIMLGVTIATVLTVTGSSVDRETPKRMSTALLLLFTTSWYARHAGGPLLEWNGIPALADRLLDIFR